MLLRRAIFRNLGFGLLASLVTWSKEAWASAYDTAVLADSPNVYYKLGEANGAGGAADSSGNAHTGTYNPVGVTYGATALMVGDTATAITLGGVGLMDSNVSAQCNPGTGDFAVEIWIKSTSSALNVSMGKLDVSGTGDSYWIGHNAAGKAEFSTANVDNTGGGTADIIGSITVNDGNPHQLVGVKSGATMRLYVDGVADGTHAWVGSSTISPGGNMTVGQFGYYTLFRFTGTLGHAAYYPASLSAARVLAHYNAGTGATQGFSITPTTIDPHTTGIVLTLVGSSTAWDGTTVFTVSGAGTTKTAQNVTGATAATVTVTTTTSSGTVTVTETVTGTGSSNTTQVLTYKKILVTTGGVDVMILEPAQYIGGGANLIYYYSGVGEDRNSLLTDSLKAGCVAQFISDGYLLAGISAGNNWGNQTALNNYVTAFSYLASQYPILGTMIWSQSMGGCAGLLNLAARAYVSIKGWLGTYPVCNLADMYGGGSGTFAGQINTAYGITNPPTYATQTAGHDPVLLSASAFYIRMRFYASSGDTVVNEAANSTQMQTLVASVAIESVIVQCTGDHGDPSHFQPSDYSAFAARCFATRRSRIVGGG